MNAQQAREITNKNLNEVVIKPILEHLYKRITKAAEEGKFEIVHPFMDIKPYPSTEMQEAVCMTLTAEGYKVKHHPDPDPGHPASGPYTTVSW